MSPLGRAERQRLHVIPNERNSQERASLDVGPYRGAALRFMLVVA
jgi:hypothetical protein